MDKLNDFSQLDFGKEKKKIGLRLKQIRKRQGYTSHETFAYEIGFDRAQYGKYEAGSSNITLGTLIKLLNKLQTRLSDFFNDDYDKIKV
ncbi:helix-turn-helix domain-containing protein [Pedobacter helvus]|uniref:Helix-turn-helix domain-containing protein n=1 Tax=Pedobacter helvus TaxID=2563444 RepID=A0ABW9JM04_9SPHI|nr:helix-turn-helix transcriptional regulator [Pedobacter ureilyticus]